MNQTSRTTVRLLLSVVFFAVRATRAQSPGNSDARVESILAKMSLQEKIDYIGGAGFAIRAMPNLHLPAFEMSDGPLGVRSNSRFPSTVYAAGIGLAATWNRDLAEHVGAGIGRDARARGIHFMLGPGVNIYRSPRNGRNFEYFREDPFLASAIAVGYITGKPGGLASTRGEIYSVDRRVLRRNQTFRRNHLVKNGDRKTIAQFS
jgi:beta-glucosidase